MDAKKTGAFIKALRIEKQLTQQALARRLSLTNKAISRWETGEGFPDVFSLPQLSQVLNVSVDELLQGERVEAIRHLPLSCDLSGLENVMWISRVIVALAFALFVGLTYITHQMGIGFLIYLILAVSATAWLLIIRNKYLRLKPANPHHERLLFNSLLGGVLVLGVTFAMTLPQFIVTVQEDGWRGDVLTLEAYLFAALFSGLVGVYLVLNGFVYFYHGRKQLRQFRPLFNHLNLFLTGIFLFIRIEVNIFINFLPLVGTGAASFYLILGGIEAVKHKRWLQDLLIRFAVVGVLLASFNSAELNPTVKMMFQILFFALIAVIIYGWIRTIRTQLTRCSFVLLYHSTLLMVYGLMGDQLSALTLVLLLSVLIVIEGRAIHLNVTRHGSGASS